MTGEDGSSVAEMIKGRKELSPEDHESAMKQRARLMGPAQQKVGFAE